MSIKYLLYDIKYYEQFYKQFAGFMYFLTMSIPIKCTLVLPKFRTLAKDIHNITINHNKDHKYYQWCDFYDVENIRKKYNIITIDEFKKLDLSIDLLFSRGNDFINHNKILFNILF